VLLHAWKVWTGDEQVHNVAAIAENCTCGAHEGSGNVISQMTGFPSVSTCGPNECLASSVNP